MDFIGKKYKAYECFADFVDNIGTKEYRQFADLFVPMLFKENCHNIFISVGIKSSKSFVSWLSTKFKKFIVVLNVFNKEPQLIIRSDFGFDAVAINLTLMKNLHIEIKDNPDSYYYEDIL